MIPASWHLPFSRYVEDPELVFTARASCNYRPEGLWFVQGRAMGNTWMVPKVKNVEGRDKYHKTEYAAREVAAVLNLEVAVHRRLQEVARSAQNQEISRGEAQDGCSF